MTADSANEVINIEDNQVEKNMEFSSNVDDSFVEGVGKAGKRIVVILNLERILKID